MSQDKSHRTKLARLGNALVEDILTSPDSDILAEVDAADIKRARMILAEVKTRVSIQILQSAKLELEAWRSTRLPSGHLIDRSAAQNHFDKIRRTDPAFNQSMTIAARNGAEPTDCDKEGLMEDWAELERLERKDNLG